MYFEGLVWFDMASDILMGKISGGQQVQSGDTHMKVTVCNLGVLKEVHVTLKPLTIFIGENNTGKTWLAYALAGVLGPYGLEKYIQAYTERQVPEVYESLERVIEQVIAEGNATLDLRQFADDYGEKYFNNVALFARTWMHRFLSTQLVHFDEMDIVLDLADSKEQFLQQIRLYARKSSIAIDPKGSLLTIRKSQDDDKLYIYTVIEEQEEQEEHIGESIPPEEIRERLVGFVSTALHRALYPQIRLFPTERTTLVALRFSESIVSREQLGMNQKIREALEVLTQELDMRALIEERSAIREAIVPVGSFLSMLRTIFRKGTIQREEREERAQNDPRIKQYMQLAEVLEQDILAGNVAFSTPEPDPRREVLFQPAQGVHLEIPIASSMVKELSTLVLYLRYLAVPGEMLIIDEPEMNLHPSAQVKIIEFLATLANAGLHVLVTSHSPYVVDHLINLIEASKHQNQDEIVEMFLLERKDAFIAQEKVGVYFFDDDGEVKDILDQDGIIHWQTFSDVSELLASIHFELYEV
ncbi:MAG: AAA family ATPase [Chloroflexota bacterium]|nr:AAA family ATPase [Chloroflexota bacterium]